MGVGGGHAYGPAGPTHHSYFDLAMMSQLPNMVVFCPADPVEMREVMYAAYKLHKPTYIRIGRSTDPLLHEGKVNFEIGKALKMREGTEAVLIATGTVVKDGIKAVDLLQKQGISCALYSMPTIKPMDQQLIEFCAENYSHIYTLEEHSVKGGLGGVIGDILLEEGLSNTQLYKFGFPDTFAPVTGSREYLNALYKIDAESVAKKIAADLQKGE